MDISTCNQFDITFCKSCDKWKHISEHIENISFFKYCIECRENKKKENKTKCPYCNKIVNKEYIIKHMKKIHKK